MFDFNYPIRFSRAPCCLPIIIPQFIETFPRSITLPAFSISFLIYTESSVIIFIHGVTQKLFPEKIKLNFSTSLYEKLMEENASKALFFSDSCIPSFKHELLLTSRYGINFSLYFLSSGEILESQEEKLASPIRRDASLTFKFHHLLNILRILITPSFEISFDIIPIFIRKGVKRDSQISRGKMTKLSCLRGLTLFPKQALCWLNRNKLSLNTEITATILRHHKR